MTAEHMGTGWDDAIDVEPVALPSTHEVPSMTAHGSVVHHRSERGVWCRESRVFLGSDSDLSLHRCSAAADHQSADWSCTIKLVDLEFEATAALVRVRRLAADAAAETSIPGDGGDA